ncbi:MAG: T9SS type A sorting domain-containing protein [Flavobacteriales bacterium]
MLRNTFLMITALLGLSAAANLAVNLTVYHESCGNANGEVVAEVSGGALPYTYAWSNGGTDLIINNLVPGAYSVTVTDNLGTQVTANATVLALGYIDFPSFLAVSEAGLHACAGMCNGGFRFDEGMVPNAVQPFSFDLTPAIIDGPGQYTFLGYCGGQQAMIQITDDAGCMGTFSTWTLTGSGATPTQLVDVSDACNGQLNGSVTVELGEDPVLGGSFYTTIVDEFGVYVCCLWTQNTGLYTFDGLGPGSYKVHREVTAGVDGCVEELPFTIADLGSSCGSVSGDNWYDVDQDCVLDGGEAAIPYHVLEIQPGPEYALTNPQGHYSRNLLNGSFTLAQTNPTLIPICPVTQPVPFTLNSDAQVIDLADGSTQPLDLAIIASQGAARPGFSFAMWAHAANLSPQLSGAVTITCAFDPQLVLSSAVPVPTNIIGNLITWDLPAFGSFAMRDFAVHFDVPVGLALGTVLSNQWEISNTLGADIDPGNDVATLTTTVVGSYDPNAKEVRTSSGLSATFYFIDQDEYMDYTVHFQNTGTATAIDVIVTDTLAADLDMGSFAQGPASHPFDVSFRPDRVVEWRFANIQLPDSGANETDSHGSVNFRIRPLDPLLPGTVISNTANIFFDFNDPVITEPSVLTAEFSTGVDESLVVHAVTAYPNPASDRLFVNGGSGTFECIRVANMDGRMVLDLPGRGNSSVVDVSELSTGTYVLTAKTSDGCVQRLHFSVLHP